MSGIMSFADDMIRWQNTKRDKDVDQQYRPDSTNYFGEEEVYTASEPKQEEAGFWDWLIGQSGEEVKEQQQNFSAYNKAKNEELANPSAPGTYSFGYNNAADYTPDKVGKAIANGDLKEKNQQLYRRYYDPQKNAMLYETIPVAEIGKKGEIKPYKYKADLGTMSGIEQNSGNNFGFTGGMLPALAKTVFKSDYGTYNDKDFQKQARSTTDRDSFNAGFQALNQSFADSFNPVEVINSIFDDRAKTRSNIEKYRDVKDIDATSIGQFGGEIAGSVAKMLMGNAAGGAMVGAKTGLALGGLLPEVGEHTRKAFEDDEYLTEALRLGVDTGLNAAGMKIGAGLGKKATEALAAKGVKGAAGAIAKNILGQTAVDAAQAGLDVTASQYGNNAIQKQLYGQETPGTELLKSFGKQVAMSVLFNSVTELPSAARAIARDVGLATKWTKLGNDRIVNNIEKVADGIINKMPDKAMTKTEIDRYVASEGAMKVGRSKQGLDILKSFLYSKSNLINTETVTNQIIKAIDDGLDDSAILRQLKDDFVAVSPLDVDMAKKNLEGLRTQIDEAPVNPQGIKSKLTAYTNPESGKLEFRFEEPAIKAEQEISLEEQANPLDITTAQPTGIVNTVNDGTMSTITPEATSSIAGYVQALNRDVSLAKTPYVIEKMNALFGVTAGDTPDFNNPDGVSRLFQIYTKLTGNSPLQKPVKDVVNVVVKHLQGIGTRKNWDNPQLKYEYIDKQVEGDYTNPVVDLIAYGDRKRLYEEMVKTIDGGVGTPLQRMNKMAEVFGLKPIGKNNSSGADEFANVTANSRMSVEDMIDAYKNYVAAPVVTTPKGKAKAEKQPTEPIANTPQSIADAVANTGTNLTEDALQKELAKRQLMEQIAGNKAPVSEPIPEPLPMEQPMPVVEQPIDVIPTQPEVANIDNTALGDLGLATNIPVRPQEQVVNPEAVDNIPNETNVQPEPVMDETPIQQPTPEIDREAAKAQLIREMQERSKIEQPIAEQPAPEPTVKVDEQPVVNDEPTIKEEPIIENNVIDEPTAKQEEGETLTENTDEQMPSEVIKSADETTPSSRQEETIDEPTIKEEIVEEPKQIEKDPIVEKDDVISEKLENGVAKQVEEPQGTKPAPSWANRLANVVADIKAEKAQNEPVMPDTPTRPEVITYPKDDKSAKQAKTKFWEANEGLKESLPDEDVKKINKVLGSSKLVTDSHQKYIDKILGNDVKVETGEIKQEGTIDDRLDEVSEALDEAKMDEAEPDIPMVDTEPAEIKTASQGIVEKAQSGRMAQDLLNRHSKFKISDEDIKDNFNDLPESSTYMLRIVRPDNPEGLTRIEFMPKHGEKPLGVEGLQNIKDNLEAVFPNITKKQREAFRIDNEGKNLSLIGAEPNKGASKILTKKDAKILNPELESKLTRSESLVDLRDKLKSVPRDIATVSIIDGKMKIKLPPDPEAKSNFEQYLIENNIDISKYHKNIEGTIKKMIDPDQKGLVPEFDITGIDKPKGNSDNGIMLQASLIPFSKQMLKNPAFQGFILSNIGNQLDNDEEQNGWGAAMKWVGTSMMAYYGGKTAVKWVGKVMAEPLRDESGKIIGLTHMIERIKTKPKELMVASPLTAKQKEYMRSQLPPKERAEFDRLTKSFDNTESIFKKTSTKIGRSWALVKGERMRKLQIETAAGKITQDRFYAEVGKLKDAFHKTTGNDIAFEAKIIRANDELYRRTTDISNDLTLKKEDKGGLIKDVTSEKALREELAKQGVDANDMDKAMNAYNQMREVSNTATVHYVRAWLLDRGIDYDKIPQILNELERTAMPTKAEINVYKEKIKDIKSQMKAKDISKEQMSELKKALNVQQQGLKGFATQLVMIKNRMKFINYAKDFAEQSANMHHVIDRWAYAKKDNPYGLAVYEVAKDNSGRYIRTNDVTSAQKEMEYFKTVEERNTAEQELLNKYNPQPVEDNSKVFKVTIDGKETYVKIENQIDNNLNSKWVTTNKNILKQQLLELFKGTYDIPAIRNGLAKISKSINDDAKADWDGGIDMEESAIMKETLEAADRAIAGITDQAQAISTLKDIFKYTLQPKARPFYRNKNVNGYQPKDDKGWVDMWATGLDSQMKSTGNRYVSATFRNAIENELIDAKMVGFDGDYTRFLASQLDDLNNTKSQSLIPEDMTAYKAIKGTDSVLSQLALAWNTKSAPFNVLQGNLATFMGLVSEGNGLIASGKAMLKSTQGFKSSLRNNTDTPYKDDMLNAIHKEIIDSRIPYSTSVEHSKTLNEGRWGKLSDKLMVLQSWTENMNRYQAAMASAITTMQAKPFDEVSSGMTKEQYIKDVLLNSANFTYATQGNFDFMFRSKMEKFALKKTPFGSTMLTLKSPFINQVLLYSNIAKQAVGMASEDKAQAAKLIAALVMVPLFGGVQSIPGATDLLNLVDMFGSEDKKDSINTAIGNVKEKIGEICEDITGSKEVADVMERTISGGIISALTDYNMTNDASIGEALIPFIAQKGYSIAKEFKNIDSEKNYLEGFAKLLLKQVPTLNNKINAVNQITKGYKMDSKGNPLSEEYTAGDFVRESLTGKSFTDVEAIGTVYKGDEELTSQGLHKTLTDLRSYTGIRFAKSEIGNRRAKELVTNELRDPDAIRDKVDEVKDNLNISQAVKTSDEKLKEWVGDNPLKAARIAGKWLNDEPMKYQGVNRDMEKMVRGMKNKVSSYYKAHVMSGVIYDMTGKKSTVSYDKIVVDYNGRKERLDNIPFEERGYYYAIGSDKEVKKKEGLYADTDE